MHLTLDRRLEPQSKSDSTNEVNRIGATKTLHNDSRRIDSVRLTTVVLCSSLRHSHHTHRPVIESTLKSAAATTRPKRAAKKESEFETAAAARATLKMTQQELSCAQRQNIVQTQRERVTTTQCRACRADTRRCPILNFGPRAIKISPNGSV